MGIDVLITDGTHKNSLAAIQSIGSEYSVAITVPKPRSRAVCNYSKFVKRTIELAPTGEGEIDAYGEQLCSVIKDLRPRYFLPVGLKSYRAAVKRADEINGMCKCLLPDPQSMETAYRKDLTMDLARKLGIPFPRTWNLRDLHDLDIVGPFPVVIKSSDTSGKSIFYCRDRGELGHRYEQLSKVSSSQIIAQEYFEGEGCGFYGVYHEGQLIDFFIMRRLREFPITGGPASYARSFHDADLHRYGKALGDALHWNGPIMVEFKRNASTGEIRLIEINPKLWGSLGITISAGVDVPRIILGVLDGKIVSKISSEAKEAHYSDITYRWIFPDDFAVAMAKGTWGGLSDFITTRQSFSNITLADPIPALFNIGTGLIGGFRLLVNEELRYPHGRTNGR
ncbi:MAG: ATP-grasp domain-containing protein [Methanomassiliicoccales archaeon]|jgi:predicted ATP-grasp superfamily ATP-dependent carboligase